MPSRSLTEGLGALADRDMEDNSDGRVRKALDQRVAGSDDIAHALRAVADFVVAEDAAPWSPWEWTS